MTTNIVSITELIGENCENNIVYLNKVNSNTESDLVAKTDPLKKDGLPKKTRCYKQKGKSSEVYAFEFQDAKSILEYFEYKEAWIHILIFVLTCNMARRISDTLDLTWENLFNPATGEFRSQIEITEQKTRKNAKVYINSVCRKAIKMYIEKTGVDPSLNGYKNPVFIQTKGNYKGRVITDEGYCKALKKAAEYCGVEYNVGTHSGRKMAGKVMLESHPEDVRNMAVIQSLLNHSSQNTTMRYIGKTKEMENQYLEDLGNEFTKYVIGDETYNQDNNTPIVHLDINDLRDIIKAAYIAGTENSNSADPSTHIETINQIMKLVDTMKK